LALLAAVRFERVFWGASGYARKWALAIGSAARIRRTRRQYRKDTLILETDFETSDGAVTITDFMPPREKHSDLVRLVRGRRGAVPMKMEFILRFNYGKSIPWVTQSKAGVLRAIVGPSMVVLRTPAPIRGEGLYVEYE
jgi:GH15 family glucan-1,4-alpha-glucosidase